jgi:hypothetical protein
LREARAAGISESDVVALAASSAPPASATVPSRLGHRALGTAADDVPHSAVPSPPGRHSASSPQAAAPDGDLSGADAAPSVPARQDHAVGAETSRDALPALGDVTETVVFCLPLVPEVCEADGVAGVETVGETTEGALATASVDGGDPVDEAGGEDGRASSRAEAVVVPLTRRALRAEVKPTRPSLPLRAMVRRRPPAPRPGGVAHRHIAQAPPHGETLDGVGLAARKALRPMGAAAAAAVAATMVQVGLPTSHEADHVVTDDAPEINALTPLRDTVEQVAQRGVMEQASRSSLVRTVSLAKDAELDVVRRSNSTITLWWDNPKLTEGDAVVVRRTEGAKAAETVKDGADVPLDNPQASELVDQGLVPESEYSYAVFVKRADTKPQLVATATATTRLDPIELRAGDSMVRGEKLVSENGRYTLELDEEGTLFLANKTGLRLWSPASGGETLVQDSSGALTLSDGVEQVWSTPAGTPGAVTRLTDGGDVQVLAGDDVVWRRGEVGDVTLGDDYPFSRGSPLGYSPNNCTDFVAWRLNRYAGITKGGWRFTHWSMTSGGGNAVQWASHFPEATDDRPALGAVAWWGSNTGRGRGHVAIVSAIREDGSILIEEYNFYNRGNYGTRVLRPGASDWPARFIHINDL